MDLEKAKRIQRYAEYIRWTLIVIMVGAFVFACYSYN